jgi:hypothetical protein
MSQPFKVRQGDITFYANFAEPAFAIFRDGITLHRTLYQQLSRFGLRVADMKPERASNLGDTQLACSLLNLSTEVRVRIERIEVMCWDLSQISQETFTELALISLGAIASSAPNNPFKTYSLSVNLHGSVEGVTTRDFLSRFAPPPLKTLGAPLASGLVFYYGAEAERVSSFVTLDLSGVQADALYTRLYVVWDAGRISPQDLPAAAEKYFGAAFDGIGLVWPPQPAN